MVVPKGIATTSWPAVCAVCETGFKITFDPWQVGAGKAILGRNKQHLYAADAIVMSIPRQVGKTFLVGAIVFALSVINPGTLTLWTAHRYATAEDTFNDLKAFAERPEVAQHVRKVYDSAGKQRILFRNGSRIVFGARERGFGRGFKKVGILVFDEAQILTGKAVDDMVPATSRHPNPLIFYIGTPPAPGDPSERFATLRGEALSGEDRSTLYIEFSAEPGADVRDRDQWRVANPSYPRHTTTRAMNRLLKNLGAEAFLRECLGIWDETATPRPFTAGAWAKISTSRQPPKPAALGVAADVDQVWLSLGAASTGRRPLLGSVLRVRASDQEHFVAEVARIQAKHSCPVVVDPKGPAGYLIEHLEAAGVEVTPVSQDDYVQACTDLRNAVHNKTVRHGDFTELNDAVEAAGWRNIGDRRVFGRRKGDISMLEAVTVALWATVSNYDVEDSFL